MPRILFTGGLTSTLSEFAASMTLPTGYRAVSAGWEVPDNTNARVVASRPKPRGTGDSETADAWIWKVDNPSLEEVTFTGWVFAESGAATHTLEVDQSLEDRTGQV
jgi:hypothetical protein